MNVDCSRKSVPGMRVEAEEHAQGREAHTRQRSTRKKNKKRMSNAQGGEARGGGAHTTRRSTHRGREAPGGRTPSGAVLHQYHHAQGSLLSHNFRSIFSTTEEGSINAHSGYVDARPPPVVRSAGCDAKTIVRDGTKSFVMST